MLRPVDAGIDHTGYQNAQFSGDNVGIVLCKKSGQLFNTLWKDDAEPGLGGGPGLWAAYFPILAYSSLVEYAVALEADPYAVQVSARFPYP